MKKALCLILAAVFNFQTCAFAAIPVDVPPSNHISIVGGGIIGALESFYAYKDAEKEGKKVHITLYEKGNVFDAPSDGELSTHTFRNIAASLTIDEIFCVVPRGCELTKKLAVLFSEPGGIRVDDVPGVNDSEAAVNFKEAVAIFGLDTNHDDRTLALLTLGKRSVELWQQMYDEGDAELKAIMIESNYNPCREPKNTSKRVLHDGYRIDLIYGIPEAVNHALSMKADYERLGYKNCALLNPDDVVAIDPYLADYCAAHSELDANHHRVWKNDSIALWRPGGCIDGRIFLPKLFAYMKKHMGQYRDADGHIHDCFEPHFNSEVTGVNFDSNTDDVHVVGLKFADGSEVSSEGSDVDHQYVFCPGEAIGTLHHLGFKEPAYAAFAGPSLLLTIPLSPAQVEEFNDFSHCMEVHNVGIVLAWQARFTNNSIFIGVAGTKAFYGDKAPKKDEDFATNRNLVQLNMINNVLPEFISLACGYDTKGKAMTSQELAFLEQRGIARRWVGRRAVAYDGFPTFGPLYHNDRKVANARCTTHLGSGGASFGPGAVYISRNAEKKDDALVSHILMYADSRRSPE